MPHTVHLAGCRAASDCDCEARRYQHILLLTLAIAGIEFFGNLFSGSVALLADMMHVLLDSAAAGISMFVANHARTHATPHVFRLRWMRVSASLLLIALVMIAYKAYGRYEHPQPVTGGTTMLAAGMALLINFWQSQLVPHDHTVTAKAQRLHVFGDLLTSGIVLIAGGLILFTGRTVIDPIASWIVVAIVGTLTVRMLITGDSHEHHH